MHHRDAGVSQPSITSIPPEIFKSDIRKKLDGKSLVSLSSVSTELNSLCDDENLWKDLCNSTWPSSLDPLVQTHIESYRHFFSDASSVKIPTPENQELGVPRIKNLISAVDIFYGDEVIFSRSVLTVCSSSWFSVSPFKIDILEPNDVVPMAVSITGDERECISALAKSLKLSWILVDGNSKRALSISSMCSVSVRRHWVNGEIQIRYATVVPDGRGGDEGEALVQCAVVVSCREEEMQAKEVSLIVEDNEGLILDGNEGLEIVQELINGERRKKSTIEEKGRYEKFEKLKSDLSNMNQREEKRLDMFVVFAGLSVFVSLLCMLLLSR